MASHDRGFNPAGRLRNRPNTQLPGYSTRLPQRKVLTSSVMIKSSKSTSTSSKANYREQNNIETLPDVSTDYATNLAQTPFPVRAEEQPSVLSRWPSIVPSALPVLSGPIGRSTKTSPFEVQSKGKGSSITSKALSEPAKSTTRQKILRRKPSTIGRPSTSVPESTVSRTMSSPPLPNTDSSSVPGGYTDPFPESMLGMAFPKASASNSFSEYTEMLAQKPSSHLNVNQPSYELPYKLAIENLPPPTPMCTAYTSSSSTRYSESLGAFSTTSTPTSISSHSPGTLSVPKLVQRVRQPSPTQSRPPVTRIRAGGASGIDATSPMDTQGLPSVRESLTSSSSGSTVKAGNKGDKKGGDGTKDRLPPPPPTPSPRKSSTKLHRSRSASNDSYNGVNHVQIKAGITSTSTEPSAGTEKAPGSEVSKHRATPPLRPSRVGAPELDIFRKPSPVIRSNLTRLVTTGHKRRESFEASKFATSPRKDPTSAAEPVNLSAQTQHGAGLGIMHVNPSAVPESPHVHRKPSHGPSLNLERSDSHGMIKRGASQTTAITSKSPSRFGFLSRRSKADHSSADDDSVERLKRKGPVAGTGHEGYNKYALRGRSGSITSNSGSWARSASAGSTSGSGAHTASTRKSSITSRGDPEMDEFFLDRLAPVVIGGGGGVIEKLNVSAEVSRRGSIQSSVGGRPSLESRTSTKSRSKASSESQRPSFGVHALSRGVEVRPEVSSKQPATNRPFQAQEQPKLPTLASRRSLHKSQLFNKREPVKIPAPIITTISPASPSMYSHDTGQSSMPYLDSTLPHHEDLSEGKEGYWLKPRGHSKQPKSPSKWNFFQRSQNAPSKDPTSEIPASITTHATPRSVAHYAMLDSAEEVNSLSLDTVLPDSAKLTAAAQSVVEPRQSEAIAQPHPVNSVLLPNLATSPPEPSSVSRHSTKSITRRDEEETPQQLGPSLDPCIKSTRLPQVGRIPRVVSTRDRNRNLPIQSFSRPFIKTPVENTLLPRSPLRAPQSHGAMDRSTSPNLTNNPRYTGSQTFDVSPSAVVSENRDEQSEPREFLSFPSRMASDASYSSSSGIMSFAATTAVIPTSDAAPGEDEVWDEYDDFIDEVLSPKTPKTPLSATSSLGAPFQYADFANPTSSEDVAQDESHSRQLNNTQADIIRTSSVPPTMPLYAEASSLSSPRRGSKLFPVLRSSTMPSTPSSFTEFFAGYGERNISDPSNCRSSGHSRHISLRSANSNAISTAESSKDHGRPKDGDTKTIDCMRRYNKGGLESHANLRFGALMTSRWLSFGRVLFSPAHLEVKQNRHDRVLILDGLGNDDWSFYCALTYPSATIYNLSPSPSSLGVSANGGESGAWSSPSNHRQIHHSSIAAPFPFPKGFFAAVVFRFPVASSDASYRNAISESKRVLRPGGHIEMSVLDLDMMNMGNRTRRAVRMLKVRMQVADAETSLKPASDNIQRMLGRRGFENLNRCMVGMPVGGSVSSVNGSRSTSVDEGQGLSLTDMLKDTSQGGDEGITKCVARVGRWWYTRCYEMGITVGGESNLDESIWNDPALIKECERRGTSFRLLVCYAQKPLVNRRRTVSV